MEIRHETILRSQDADMLGVPQEDHEEFRTVLGAPRPGAQVGSLDGDLVGLNPLAWLDDKFVGYLEDRRPNANVDPYVVARLLTETVCSAIEKG